MLFHVLFLAKAPFPGRNLVDLGEGLPVREITYADVPTRQSAVPLQSLGVNPDATRTAGPDSDVVRPTYDGSDSAIPLSPKSLAGVPRHLWGEGGCSHL